METSVARTEQRGGGLMLDGSDRGAKKWILEIDLFLYLLIFCFFFFLMGETTGKKQPSVYLLPSLEVFPPHHRYPAPVLKLRSCSLTTSSSSGLLLFALVMMLPKPGAVKPQL